MLDELTPAFAARFHDIVPAAIVRCQSPGDVTSALELARTRGLPVAVRSGGHCFAGGSSTAGLLLDVRPMAAIAIGEGTVEVGAGARLGEIYDALAPRGVTIAAGCGPTVGVSGLLLGGGLGLLGRTHGLLSDQLVAAEVVLADGRIVRCDEREHADLFWALRGAGATQAGVVTRMTLRTVPAPRTTTVHLRWGYEDAPAVLDAWQEWSPDAPDHVAVSLLVTAGADPAEAPVVHAFGAVLAGEAEARAQLAPLGPAATTELRERSYREAKAHLAAHGPSEGAPPSDWLYAKSEFFRASLPAGAAGDLLTHVAADRVAGQHRSLDLSPWAGAYNAVPEGATAFAHRAERFLLKHEAIAPRAEADAARAWTAESWAIAHPHGSGRAYPNFPDPELEDWPRAAHSANLGRLRDVRAAYDPDGVFAGS